MKKMLFIASLGLLATGYLSLAQSNTPSIRENQTKQEVKHSSLTPGDARKLRNQQSITRQRELNPAINKEDISKRQAGHRASYTAYKHRANR